VDKLVVEMNPLAKSLVPGVMPESVARARKPETAESLFERSAWIYIFCREKLFRDDTSRIIRRLWQNSEPRAEIGIIEVGCGPGFYARSLATRYPKVSVLGIDDSKRQLQYARVRAFEAGLRNCEFEQGNVLDLDQEDDSFDVVIASRLFTVVLQRERAVAEMFRVLRPGGKCFVAEPRFAFSAAIPLLSMRLLARLSGYLDEYREPTKAITFTLQDFRALLEAQPWAHVETWRRGRYQYALCEKG
jgi:arsenite methyltransferase